MLVGIWGAVVDILWVSHMREFCGRLSVLLSTASMHTSLETRVVLFLTIQIMQDCSLTVNLNEAHNLQLVC